MAEVLEFNQMFYTNFEPKVKNRFIMEIDGIPSYLIHAANRPKYKSEVMVLDHINLKRKLKGKSEWEDIDITLYDPIVPSGAQAVMEWVRLSHESLTGRNGYAEFYKKDVNCYMLGPVGDKIEQWTLKGAFINAADFGEVNWANGGASDFMTIKITLSYDYAVLEY
jgi:hypothetical protein